MPRKALILLTLIIVVATAAGGTYYLTHGPARPEQRILRAALVGSEDCLAKTGDEPAGLGVELVNVLTRMSGYDSVEIRPSNLSEALKALRRGEVQLVLLVSPAREPLNTSNTLSLVLWDCRKAVVVSAEASAVGIAARVGVPAGQPVETGVKATSMIEGYSDLRVAVESLLNGTLGSLVVDLSVAQSLAQRYNVTIVQVSGQGNQLRLLVSRDNEILYKRLADALEQLSLSDRWLDLPSTCLEPGG